MKFSAFVFELRLPQNCQTEKDRHFLKINCLKDIPKQVNPSKFGNRNFTKNITKTNQINFETNLIFFFKFQSHGSILNQNTL